MDSSPRFKTSDRSPRLTIAGVAWVMLLSPFWANSEPFVPREGSQVLERVRNGPTDEGASKLRELHARLAGDLNNLELASQFARECIDRNRRESNPKYLGRAQAALAPWWNAINPPAEALILRATIRQAQHEFRGALADLDLALRQRPRDAQAWLTRATVLTVLGDYPAARRACFPLAQLAPGLLALSAAANVSCLSGDAEGGCSALREALNSYPHPDSTERIWALTIHGEASARLGHWHEAENSFKAALSIDPHDCYVLAAYADLLLDQGRAREVVSLLREYRRIDGLLLRLALAEAQIDRTSRSFRMAVESLESRFEAGRLRGDFLHLREQARFLLQLRSSPAEALRAARENWQVQHEPADARLLLECARAARDAAAAEPVMAFLRVSHLQDVRLQQLTAELAAIASK